MERVLEAKLLPPVIPRVLVPRPRLEARLAEALSRRLTAIVAPAGFGKSTLMAAWAETNRCAWYTVSDEDVSLEQMFDGVAAALRLRVPGLVEALRELVGAGKVRGPDALTEEDRRAREYAGLMAMQLEYRLASDLVLVLDDLHVLPSGSASERFVEALCRQAPTHLHLVLLSRRDLPFPTARLRAQGQAVELTGAIMAFTADETVELMAGVVGGADPSAAAALQELTRGWPAAVRLGAEALSERADPSSVQANVMPESVFSILAEEVFDVAAIEVTDLVRTVAHLDAFTAALCEALGLNRPREILDALERRGLFLVPYGGEEGWYSLHPLVRDFAKTRLVRHADDARPVLLRAASWLEDAGHLRQALRCRAAAGDDQAVLATLRQHGSALVAAGGAAEVIATIEGLSPALRTNQVDELEGEARHAVGDWDGALRCFDRLGTGDELLPPGAAWRSGLIHYQRGDLDAALRCYERGMWGDEDEDRSLVSAWAAAVHWLRGEIDRCRELAGEAFEMARACNDERALAAAHTALAMVAALEGDRRANDAHYLRAITYAERAGDSLQLIRIRTNRGSRLVEEGHYIEALQELDDAIRLADLAGYGSFRALALTNRGQALLYLGRLDEAVQDLTAAREHYERTGSLLLAYPLSNLGDVYLARGERSLAQAVYEEAIDLAEPTGDLQGLVPALCGLARVIVGDNPGRARRLAERAASSGPTLGRPRAMVAAGWVALTCGRRAAATAWAKQAANLARLQRDRASAAEALEVEAMSFEQPEAIRSALEEVASLWRTLGNPLAEARVQLEMARQLSGGEAVALAESAAVRFRAAGARAAAAEATALAIARRREPDQSVRIQVLGSFHVTRRSGTVTATEWGSRKPRDLLKILVARRGGPVRRDVVLEVLWPTDDPVRSRKKLSVALSTLRAVLDPNKQFEPDHFLAADSAAVWLILDHLDIDLERFLDAADAGLRRHPAGSEGSVTALRTAEAAYGGDPFEEDAYEEWAEAIRESVRTTYVAVIRALADHAAGVGEHDVVFRLLLRVLEEDRYDEGAHLALVRSLRAHGRHGEARRMYRTYCDRMEEIAIEPATFPDAVWPPEVHLKIS